MGGREGKKERRKVKNMKEKYRWTITQLAYSERDKWMDTVSGNES